jgi:hypothetical protein
MHHDLRVQMGRSIPTAGSLSILNPDAHGGPHEIALCAASAAHLWAFSQDEKPGPPSQNFARAYGARETDNNGLKVAYFDAK